MPSTDCGANMQPGSNSTGKYIDGIDPDDPEYQRMMMRPAEIKEDVKLMEQRKRVSLILRSEAFRRELEEVMGMQTKAGVYPGPSSSLLSLHQLADVLQPAPGKQPITAGGFTRVSSGGACGIIPINDLRGTEATPYNRRERQLRCKLAAVYRLMDLFGWNSSIYNHVTVRLGRDQEHFLINPFGLLYHEVTASSLIRVDMQGETLDPGSTVLGVDKTGWVLHAALHAARPDIRCVLHLDTAATVAVSSMKSGLLPLCQEAMILGEIAHYEPSTFNVEDQAATTAAISRALGPRAKVILVRNYGLLVLGETIEEAWHCAVNAVAACEAQIRLAPLGLDNLVLPSDEVQQQVYTAWRSPGLGGLVPTGATSPPPRDRQHPVPGPWRLGELEFEALMRHLDNAGYRTGFLYKQRAPGEGRGGDGGVSDSGTIRRHEDVEIPPASSSLKAAAAQYDEGALSGDETDGGGHPGSLRRQWTIDSNAWFNTPNIYQREVFFPDGRSDDEGLGMGMSLSAGTGKRTVTRWHSVRDTEPVLGRAGYSPAPHRPLTAAAGLCLPLTVSPPSRGANVYAPQGENPKEFRNQQKKVKAKYYHDTNTAGPQSRLLDGLTWEEARRLREEGMEKVLGPRADRKSDHIDGAGIVSAASKGIIQRGHQQNAVVYDGLYTSTNPFDKVTDEDLERYRHEVERKNRPGPPTPPPAPVEIPVVMVQAAEVHAEPAAPPPVVEPEVKVEVVEPTAVAKSEVAAPTTPKPATPPPVVTAVAVAAVAPSASTVVQRPESALAPQPEAVDRSRQAALARSHSEKPRGASAHLEPPKGAVPQSETSGAEASHDDTEKEGATDKDKKKKRKFKMPSFSRKKDKDKEKEKHHHK